MVIAIAGHLTACLTTLKRQQTSSLRREDVLRADYLPASKLEK